MKTTVEDAKRSLVFEITAQDVKDAKRHDKRHCVIACAVGALPGIKSISVGATVIRVRTADRVRRYATPGGLKKALAKFDKTGTWALPAGTYKLNPPATWLSKEVIARRFQTRYSKAGRPMNPKTKKRYTATGTKRTRQVNPRVLEFMKIKKAEKAMAAR